MHGGNHILWANGWQTCTSVPSRRALYQMGWVYAVAQDDKGTSAVK